MMDIPTIVGVVIVIICVLGIVIGVGIAIIQHRRARNQLRQHRKQSKKNSENINMLIDETFCQDPTGPESVDFSSLGRPVVVESSGTVSCDTRRSRNYANSPSRNQWVSEGYNESQPTVSFYNSIRMRELEPVYLE